MTPRTSHAQIRILIEYMERNGDICRPHEGMQGRLQSYRRWTELTDILNAQGSGCTKSIEKWKKFWADLKSKTKKKAASIRSHRTSTGGGPATSIKLSIFEERIMAILGVASSIGLWSESGFPDSDEEIQSLPASAAAVISIPVALQHSDPPHTITSQTRPPSIHPSTSIMSSAGPSTSQTQYIHPPTQPFFESGPSPSQTHINPSTPIDLYTIPTTSQTHVHLSTSGTSSPESSTSQIQIHPFTPIHFTPTTTASQRRVHPPTPLQETQHVQPSSTHSRQISFTQPATGGAEQDEQTIPESVSQSPIAGINPSTRPTGPRRPPDSRRRRRFPTPFQMATEAFADIERSRIELERARMQQMDRLITMIERIGERFIELTDHMINRN